MATQKPISTISYNSEAFLKEKLDLWIRQHIIQAYQYIKHLGEDGDKNHIHLRVEPNKKLDPMDLSEALKEYVQGNDKPLGIRPWRPSKEEDWFLYVVHYEQYLKLKYGGGERGEKIPYDFTDIIVSDGYDLEIAFTRALASLKHSPVNMASRLRSGVNPLDLVLEGENVFTVNALSRALYENDYNRLLDDYELLRKRFMNLEEAVRSLGYTIEEPQDDTFVLRIIK